LVDRFIYQGLHYVPSRHAAQVRTYAESLQDQDGKGSLTVEMQEVWYTSAHIIGGWNFKLMREHAQGRGQVEDVRSSVKADIKLESPQQEMLFDLDDRGLGR
jgi:hypothetical protein